MDTRDIPLRCTDFALFAVCLLFPTVGLVLVIRYLMAKDYIRVAFIGMASLGNLIFAALMVLLVISQLW